MNRSNTYRPITPSVMLAGAILAGASIASGQIVMDPAVNYAAGSRPSGAAAGDFNGDGHMDLATVVDDPDRAMLLLNDGSGQFNPGPSIFLGSSTSPQDLVAGDLDGNGTIDLAIAVRDPVGSVRVFLNNGAGTFTAGATVTVGDRPRGMSIADIDGNDSLDLAVANRDDGTATVLINNGAASFTTMTLNIGEEPRATGFGDFNDDGMLDVAVSDHDNRNVDTFLRSGAGFVAGQTLSVGGQVRPEGVAVADVNGDALPDVIAATSSDSPSINQASVFINTGAGFSGPFTYPTGGLDSGDIVAVDLDCDGWMDLVTTDQDSNTISLLRNNANGSGSFGAATTMATGVRPGELTAADLDGDGDAEIATANRDSDNMSVFINQSCEVDPGTPGDLNGDDLVNVFDLLILLGDWGACPGCPADLNDDEAVNVFDLLILLSSWS